MNVKLIVVQGKPEGKEIPLRTSKFLIGRGTECHLRPNSELVSRHHCLFTIAEDGVVLRDLGSTNGTLVNSVRISGEVIIHRDDLVQVGPLGFRIKMDPVLAATPAARPRAIGDATPLPATLANSAKQGSMDSSGNEVDQWLVVSDSNNDVPGAGSDVFLGDTEMEIKTTQNIEENEETGRDFGPPPSSSVPPKNHGENVDKPHGMPKVEIGSNKLKTGEVREDTSSEAADMLRRIMERQPGK